MNSHPQISIVMSVYNCEKYLSFAIESILKQSFNDYEFIIVNDGSTDSTLSIINNYKNTDTRIKLIKNSNNIGLPASLNKAINSSKGKYIARQDADDISKVNRLQVQYDFMEKNAIDILGSNCSYIDIKNHDIFSDDKFSKNNSYFNILLSQKAIFPHGTAFIRSNVIKKLKGYNENFYYSQDGELWLRALKNNYKLFVMSEFLYEYRLSPISGKAKFGHKEYNRIKNAMYSDTRKSLTTSDKPFGETLKMELSEFKSNKNDDTISDYWLNIAKLTILKSRDKKYSFICIKRSLFSKGKIKNIFKIIFWSLVIVIPSGLILKNNHKNN